MRSRPRIRRLGTALLTSLLLLQTGVLLQDKPSGAREGSTRNAGGDEVVFKLIGHEALLQERRDNKLRLTSPQINAWMGALREVPIYFTKNLPLQNCLLSLDPREPLDLAAQPLAVCLNGERASEIRVLTDRWFRLSLKEQARWVLRAYLRAVSWDWTLPNRVTQDTSITVDAFAAGTNCEGINAEQVAESFLKVADQAFLEAGRSVAAHLSSNGLDDNRSLVRKYNEELRGRIPAFRRIGPKSIRLLPKSSPLKITVVQRPVFVPLDSAPKLASNSGASANPEIELNGCVWNRLSQNGKKLLALHEILPILGVADRQLVESIRYLFELSLEPGN